ncbi:MAG: 50S ribosomal protein L11 methyltransferase [Desulfovibrio sp.]|nr:50S ribosomal protein L11 methyltransferase [Desulfovibrio sp.]
MKYCYRMEIVGTESDFDKISGMLALRAPFGWEEENLPDGQTRFVIHCENQDFMRSLAEEFAGTAPTASCVVREIENQDWLAAWREFFTPVCCGSRFVVLPPWLEERADFQGRTQIVIEPKSAFGTGHHATTALCLRVLSDLLDQRRVHSGQTFLDLGTGSGILGIACGKSGLAGLCLDIDPLAIENALENSALNGTELCEISVGGIEAAAGRKFDLVLSNILAGPLIDLAPDILAVCAENACLALSGILAAQADAVERAYTGLGLPSARRLYEGEWCALIWQ